MFKRLFGSSEKPSGTSGSSAPSRPGHPNAAERTVQSIQTLQEKEDMLEKRRELLEKKIATEVDKAKQLSSQNKKPQALMCLKRKKLHEKEVENVNNLLMRILEQRNMLENSRLTAETLASMQNAAQAQKATMQEVKIENVDKVLEDINDVSDEMRTVQEALGAPIGLAAELDDDELLAELDEIAQSELDAELLDPGTVPNTKVSEAPQQSLPTVPDTVVNPPAKVSPQDLEIQELEKELGLAS